MLRGGSWDFSCRLNFIRDCASLSSFESNAKDALVVQVVAQW